MVYVIYIMTLFGHINNQLSQMNKQVWIPCHMFFGFYLVYRSDAIIHLKYTSIRVLGSLLDAFDVMRALGFRV